MSSHVRRRLLARLLSVAGLVVVLASRSAGAASPASRAIERGEEGIASFEDGRFEEALAAFREAEAIYYSPVFLFYQGRSLRRLGRYREALTTLERVDREPLALDAPAVWKETRDAAARERESLAAAMPLVVVTIEGASNDARATVDGDAVPLGALIPLDPGEHRVVASDGAREEPRTLVVTDGARRQVAFRFAPTVTIATTPPPTRPPEESRRGETSTKSVVAFALGGAAAAGSVVLGALAFSAAGAARDGLPSTCVGTVCPSSRRTEVEDRFAAPRQLAVASDILTVTAIVALGVGLYFTLRSPAASTTKLQ